MGVGVVILDSQTDERILLILEALLQLKSMIIFNFVGDKTFLTGQGSASRLRKIW